MSATFPAGSAPATNAATFRTLALARLSRQPPAACGAGPPSDFDLNPGVLPPDLSGLAPAAVLVPILIPASDHDPLSVLLTERTGHLKAHAGQISFPGGKIETGDAGPMAAALREADEEIGLRAHYVETLGYLDPYRTGTGYLITPVVALINPGFQATPDPAEVASVFEVPLDFLMDAANHTIDSRVWLGAERRFYAMPYKERYIWGATAGIIRTLYRRLFTE